MDFQDLQGKTIAKATQMKKPKYDDDGWLKLEFTDGTSCVILAGYGGYTGESEDEYPIGIDVIESDDGLEPVSA